MQVNEYKNIVNFVGRRPDYLSCLNFNPLYALLAYIVMFYLSILVDILSS